MFDGADTLEWHALQKRENISSHVDIIHKEDISEEFVKMTFSSKFSGPSFFFGWLIYHIMFEHQHF